MAVSKSFFGLRRGSTKSHTYSVLNGKQVTKDRVTEVKNPRSENQMANRCIFATASAAYAAMRQIVDHSFEGVTYGQQTMSRFIQLNANLLRSLAPGEYGKVAFNPYRDRGLYPNEYIISKGTATPIKSSGWEVAISGTVIDINILGISATAVMENLGIKVGEMCTICFICSKTPNSTDNDGRFVFVRLKALKEGTDRLTQENFGQYFEVESNEGISVGFTPSSETTAFSVGMVTGASEAWGILSVAIHSVKSDKGWLRSNTAFVLPVNFDAQPSWGEAIETYPVGASYVLNGGQVEG